MRYVISRSIQLGFQFLLLLFVKLTLQPFTRTNTTAVKPKFIESIEHVIVANHRGALDPFIICGRLPLRSLLKILPIGFMTANKFYDSPLRPLLWVSGCYPAKNPSNNHKLYGVDGSLELLRRGYSIFIFPEGKRHNQRSPAHPGVVRIHQASPTTPIILAHITYSPGHKWWHLKRSRTVTYKLVQNPYYTDPEIIMDDVFKL